MDLNYTDFKKKLEIRSIGNHEEAMSPFDVPDDDWLYQSKSHGAFVAKSGDITFYCVRSKYFLKLIHSNLALWLNKVDRG